MRLNRLLFALLVTAFGGGLQAQDVHYTLHNYAPLWLNPALTGSFYGSVRVGGIYRGQWHSIEGIQSPTAYVDAPLAFGLRKQDWIGVGLSLVNNRSPFDGMGPSGSGSGAADITENFFGFSVAYHLALDKKRQNVLTLGAQYGSISYGGEFEGLLAQQANIEGAPGFQSDNFNEFMQTPMSGPGGPGQGTGGGADNNVNDINAGVKLKLTLDPKKNNVFEAGVSLYHLTSPDRRPVFMADDMEVDTTGMNPVRGRNRELLERKSTIHAHARLDMEMSEKWRIQPTLYYQQSSASSSVSAQVWGQRNLKRDLDLRIGLGYRTGDAAQVLFGLDFAQVRAALSYDVTVSQAREVTNYQGAFELSAAYIFNIYKKPNVDPTLLCPAL